MVKIEDRNEEVERLRLALSIAGVNSDYETVDLIFEVKSKLKEKGGNFNVRDAVQLNIANKRKWNNYYNPEIEKCDTIGHADCEHWQTNKSGCVGCDKKFKMLKV